MLITYKPRRINIKGYVGNDCTINAIGTALGISYDLARKLLQTGVYRKDRGLTFYESDPRTKKEFSMRSNVIRICEAISIDKNIFISEDERKQKLKYSRRTKGIGNSQNSVAKFAETNPEGIFILLVHGHLLTVINGNVIDNWDSTNRAVEIAYRIDVEEARKIIEPLAKFYRMNGEEHYVNNIQDVEELKKQIKKTMEV